VKRVRGGLLAVSVAVSLCAPWASAQAPLVAESERPYAQALSRVWAAVRTLPIAAGWCMEKYPDTASASESALRSWRDKSQELIADLDLRMEVISRGNGWSQSQRDAKSEQLLRGARAKFDEGMSSVPVEKQQMGCEHLPADFADGKFDLELKFESELKIIRAHPIDVERPKQ
jgi:hypothetical protein